MSLVNEYTVGIIMSRAGLSDGQVAFAVDKLKFLDVALHRMTPADQVPVKPVLMVVGVHLEAPELPDVVAKVLRYKTAARIELVRPYLSRMHGDSTAFLYSHLRECDEVWCFAGDRQSMRHAARVPKLYRYAQEAGSATGRIDNGKARQDALKFKFIPSWVEPERMADNIKVKAKKEKKWKGV